MNKCAICKNKSEECYKDCHFEDGRSPADLAKYNRFLSNFAQKAKEYAKKYEKIMTKKEKNHDN